MSVHYLCFLQVGFTGMLSVHVLLRPSYVHWRRTLYPHGEYQANGWWSVAPCRSESVNVWHMWLFIVYLLPFDASTAEVHLRPHTCTQSQRAHGRADLLSGFAMKLSWSWALVHCHHIAESTRPRDLRLRLCRMTYGQSPLEIQQIHGKYERSQPLKLLLVISESLRIYIYGKKNIYLRRCWHLCCQCKRNLMISLRNLARLLV